MDEARLRGTTLLCALLGIAASLPAAAESPPRVIAYVAGWSVPLAVQADELTHINFAFAHIDAHGHVGFDQPLLGQILRKLQPLKTQNPLLRILVSVGGWQAEGFSDAALTPTSRLEFARSTVQLLREYSLDGVDLDWEYPGQGIAGIKFRGEDKQNFTLLLKTLREQLDAESSTRKPDARYTLTIAAADREYFDHVEMHKLHVYLDWINLMSYDFFNSLTPTTGHHAGLYASAHAAPTDRNGDSAVKQYLRAGVPANKIVLGVAFYGRGFTGVAPANNGLNQPYQRFEGEHSYAELAAKLVDKQGFTRYWDAQAQAPYLWNPATRTFISYEDPQSVTAKTRYVLHHRLGGIMFWELSKDRDGELLDVIVRGLNAPAPQRRSPPE
jgi:chitinase